jgi:hypothetical protein
MKSINWKDIAELLGTAAILFGLFLVYEEIQQNSVMVRAEMSSETNKNLVALDHLILDPDLASVYLKSLDDPENLTKVERMQVNTILQNVLDQYRRECYYRGIGVFSECYTVPRDTALKYFGSRYGRAFWKTVRNNMVRPNIAKIIDKVLADTSEDNFYSQIDTGVLENLANP